MISEENAASLHRLLGEVARIGIPEERRANWLVTPIPELRGSTPLECIEQGRGDVVMHYLASVAAGFVG